MGERPTKEEELAVVVGKLTLEIEHLHESLKEIKFAIEDNKDALTTLSNEFAKTRTFLHVKSIESQKKTDAIENRLFYVEMNGTRNAQALEKNLNDFKVSTEGCLSDLVKKTNFAEGSRWATLKFAGGVAFLITIVFNLIAVWFRTQPVLIKWFGG